MYPIDRRKVAAMIYEQCSSLRKTAKLLQVCHTTISRWLKSPERLERQRKTSKIYKSEAIVQILKLTIHNDPFISIRKLKFIVKDALNIDVSYELVRVAIKNLGFSKKKAHFYANTPNLELKTQEFLASRNALMSQNKTFFSIDETSFGRNGNETKGYSKIGEKVFIRKKAPRITTTSAIVCVSSDKLISKSITQGSVNTSKFLDFLKSFDIPQNSVILMDNVSFHHSKVVTDYLKDKGVDILYTPPYSPWFNPIELCFSIVKRAFKQNQDITQSFNALNSQHFHSFFNKSLQCIKQF